MPRSRTILVALLVLLPLTSWCVSSGGFPICCWGAQCRMQRAGAAGMAMCPMMRTPSGCRMMANAPVILPASLMPVAPLAVAADGATGFVPRGRPLRGRAVDPSAGWRFTPFHPPRA